MSQFPMTIPNEAGAAFRADVNSALAALVSQSSGATAPATMFAYMMWADTTNALWKMRNAANTAWNTLAPLGNTLISTSGGQLTGSLELAPSVGLTAAATTNIGGANSANVTITGTTTITAFDTVAEGIIRYVQWNAATPITYNATSMKLVGAQSRTNANGDVSIFKSLGTGYWKELLYQPMSLMLTQAQGDARYVMVSALSGYIAGNTMSTPGTSANMTVGPGSATDSTGTTVMVRSVSRTKTTSSWVSGNNVGGLDTGTIAASTWYYFYLIQRPDTGAVDVIFSLSSSAPTLPANYTLYRYIGAGLTNGTNQWTAFTQEGREFYWSTPVLDFGGAGSATAALLTCSIPSGRKMKGFFNIAFAGSAHQAIYISDPANTDLVTSETSSPLATYQADFIGVTGVPNSMGSGGSCWTNASAQIRHREVATTGIYIATLGWIDLADSQ